jgi:hypothetical protein
LTLASTPQILIDDCTRLGKGGAAMRPRWPTYWFLASIVTATLVPPIRAQDLPPRPAVEFVNGVNWQAPFRGVDVAPLQATQPRLMRGYAARIQATDPGIAFLATPDNGDRPGETDGLRTTSFLKQFDCQLAINAGSFAPVHSEEGLPEDIHGLQISRGQTVSSPDPPYPALLITRDKRLSIEAPPFHTEGVENAVPGFQIVLRQGEVLKTDDKLHPRTGAGISADGKQLYFLVIDGRQPDYSLGASTAEVGQWLQALGAADGINLDGGGTTTMVLRGENGEPQILNRPIHAGIPGRERVAASHLGVKAQRLPQ